MLRVHADSVARRLRRAGYRGRTVHVKVKLARANPTRSSERGPHYPILTRSKTLAELTDDAEQIAEAARSLWQAANVSEPIRLLGVSVSNLKLHGVADEQQLPLFGGRSGPPTSAAAHPRRELGPTLDAITQRFGAGAISRAVEDPGKVTHGRGIKHGT